MEVTIIDGYLQMNIPGVQLTINAITKGSAKFAMRLWYFADIVKAEKDTMLQFELTENRLGLRVFSFPVLTTFFSTDRILRSIQLPLNYTEIDVAKLFLSGKYTDEEIHFNNLNKEAAFAMQKVKSDIIKIFTLIKKYGFEKEDIEELIKNKFSIK